MSEQDESFEDLVSHLEASRIAMEQERLEAEQYRQETESIKRKLKEKQDKLESQRDKILRQASEDAHAILREAKEIADRTIKNFNKYGQSHPSAKEMEQERSKLRGKMNDLEKNISLKQKSQEPSHKIPKNLRIGDSVKVLSMNLKGTVHTLPNSKGDLYVQMGILRSLVNVRDLILL